MLRDRRLKPLLEMTDKDEQTKGLVCHPERSEGSVPGASKNQILPLRGRDRRCAPQDDIPTPRSLTFVRDDKELRSG